MTEEDLSKKIEANKKKPADSVAHVMGEPFSVPEGEVAFPKRTIEGAEVKEFVDAMKTAQISMFAEMVLQKGGTFTQTIPLDADGLTSDSAVIRQMQARGEWQGDKAGQTLVEYSYLGEPQFNNPPRWTVDQLKQGAARISKVHPEVTFEFEEDKGLRILIYTATIAQAEK